MSSGGSGFGLEKSCRSRLGRRLSSRAAEADPSKASLCCRPNGSIFPGVEPCLDGVELIQAPTPSVDYAAVPLGDLHAYDPAAMAWTDLSAAASGTPPSPRDFQGFASAGGYLYVHAGYGDSGEDGEARAPRARVRESAGRYGCDRRRQFDARNKSHHFFICIYTSIKI